MELRWRLILGDFAKDLELPQQYSEMDQALAFLYDNEYGEQQGVRQQDGVRGPGGRGRSVMAVPSWIRRVRRLFPKKTVEIMQRQALEKYNMTALLTDPEVLREMEPNLDLLRNILTFRSMIPANVKELAYEMVRKVVRQLQERLEKQVQRVFYGKRLPHTNSPYKVYRNFDIKQTIRRNLKHYSPELQTLVVDKVYFNQSVKRRNPWHIVILVDESGSMMDSVIYTAVMAAIFAKLPFVQIKLVIFDTAVVDLSDHLEDPVDTLMKVQLGGGTDIHKALEYGKKLITAPNKTIVVLVSDLCEGGNPQRMYRSCRDLVESGCRLFVLPALDYNATPCYDRTAAKTIAKLGAQVAAITPEELAEWVDRVIS